MGRKQLGRERERTTPGTNSMGEVQASVGAIKKC